MNSFKKLYSVRFVCSVISVCFLVILIFTTTKSNSTAVFYNLPPRSLPIYSVELDEKKVAITFDCAYGTSHTENILSYLDEYNIKATFFMVEFWVTANPTLVKTIHDKGHEIGTHSKTHGYMSKMTETEIIAELDSSSKAIENLTGNLPTVFRPPYGDYNNTLIDTAKSLGLYSIQWDVDSLDWKNLSAVEIYTRVTNKTRNGSIILCHNDGLNTAESLPLIFIKLKNEGYTFTTVSELIYKTDYKIDITGRQQKNAKTLQI